MLLPKAVTRK